MPIAPNFRSKHRKKWDIYFSQCYPNSRLKLPELTNLLQLSASEHAIECGLGYIDLQEAHQSWVLMRMRIEIHRMPQRLEEVDVVTWIKKLQGVKSSREFTVEQNGEKCIGVSSLWAVFNTQTRRPDVLQIPFDHLAFYPEEHGTAIENSRVAIVEDSDEHFNYQVCFSDLDIVNHVNNTKYLEWCLNHIDPAIILEERIKAFDQNFMKELNLNDEVILYKKTTANTIAFTIVRDEKPCYSCCLELIP